MIAVKPAVFISGDLSHIRQQPFNFYQHGISSIGAYNRRNYLQSDHVPDHALICAADAKMQAQTVSKLR